MRIPGATYRIQLHQGFPFDAARAVVPYLASLGVTDLYLSPVLQSRAGSMHGYDVTDASRVRDELGGEDGLRRLAEAARAHGMAILLDIVPNHMAASVENPSWRDVLRSGAASRYAATFDVDWEPARAGLAGKVLLPVLTTQYGEALESGALRLDLGDDGLVIAYGSLRLPLSLRSEATVLGWNLGRLERGAGAADPHVLELATVVDELASAGPHDDGRAAMERLGRLMERDERIRTHIEGNVRRWNGRPGDARSFDLLDRLLEGQAYRVAYWPVADQEINYRRFFDVNDLVAVRVEDEPVFVERLGTILRLCRDGVVSGLRVDHVDGLHDPTRFLERLRDALGSNVYVVVEKILAPGEDPPAWPIQGTTGYEVLNAVNDLFVDGEGLARLEAQRGGDAFGEEVYASKRQAITELFGGELRNLAQRLGRLAEQHRHGRDLTLTELGRALVGVTASLPVYRTYIDSFSVAARDREVIEAAVRDAARRDPDAARAILFMRHVLLLDVPARTGAAQRALWLRFVMRWQQLASAAMAKGQEDTAFYRHVALASRSEVGGHPETPPLDVAHFHALMADRAKRWPHALSTSATHDTKRGADVRARIDALSEIPEETLERFEAWRSWCIERIGPEARAIGRDTSLLLFETIVGVWPLEPDPSFADRIAAYATKAAREAKRETAWRRPNEPYERTLIAYARAVIDAPAGDPERVAFAAFADRVAERALPLSLAQTLLTMTVPGVPDVFQGGELWDLSLVDPDNRRPVDFTRRQDALAALDQGGADAPSLLAQWRDGRVKLHVVVVALRERRRRADLFARGAYLPLAAHGAHAASVVAFGRVLGAECALVVVPRIGAPASWDNTAIDTPADGPTRWRDVLSSTTRVATDGHVRLADVFRDLPVALLIRMSD